MMIIYYFCNEKKMKDFLKRSICYEIVFGGFDFLIFFSYFEKEIFIIFQFKEEKLILREVRYYGRSFSVRSDRVGLFFQFWLVLRFIFFFLYQVLGNLFWGYGEKRFKQLGIVLCFGILVVIFWELGQQGLVCAGQGCSFYLQR